MNKIRTELMADDGEQLSGDVEADETLWGGRPRARQADAAPKRRGSARQRRRARDGRARWTRQAARDRLSARSCA